MSVYSGENTETPKYDERTVLLNKIDSKLKSLKDTKYDGQKNAYYNLILPKLLAVCHNGNLGESLEIILAGLSKKSMDENPNFLLNIGYAIQNPDEVLKSLNSRAPVLCKNPERVSYDSVKELSEDDSIEYEGAYENAIRIGEDFSLQTA
jgi:hypothetical protein